ncbi:endo alpha-1,4 polygalactosaminidase [Aquihabitans sp. G128]|uniref:endo alpha-1,4 polygalactosaminidase n=1 Tax=Aquihabitans sp. G128 TaxID=2849779 RepID=UPI001C2487E0|nr:endo alpha-1,4 polygalactosaminidase [Aquihabitans sp. G128]QXC63125.1 endo alpha-1,4 polygalactosaminidase [Aquihabitans sp. G128]
MRRTGTTLATPVLALALLLGGCASDGGHDGGARPASALEAPQLADVRSFAFGLGVDPDDPAVLRRLGRYDLVVVDGETSAARVRKLQADGAVVLGYLSVGTIEPYRSWYREAKAGGWLLDEYEDWGEWYADTSAPGLRRLLVEQASATLDRGFDGLFLDNTDMVAAHPQQAAGMRALVADLDRLVGDGLLFAQNGDETVATIAAHLDGWNREDVSSTYDFDTGRYAAVGRSDHAAALATLRRLHRRGLFVTATDYVDPDGSAAAVRSAEASACRAGALPFASDIDLGTLPASPPTC